MNDFGHLLETVLELRRDFEDHKVATQNMLRVGAVADSEHGKGVRLQTGTDDEPHKTPWGRMADRTGASSYLPKVGEQALFLGPFGDQEQGIVIPFGHTDAKPDPAKSGDETVHHDRDGQRHSVENGHVKDQADDKHSRFVGDEPGDAPLGGGNFPHELQRQLQGLRAGLTQVQHNVAGLHDVTSKLRQIALPVIPALAALEGVLNSTPESLQAAAEGILGKLESYIAKDFEGMVAKLTSGLLDNVQGLVSGFMAGDIGAVLDAIEDLASANGIDVVGALADARGLVAEAAGGVADALDDPLGAMEAAFAGTPAGAAFAALQGRMSGVLGTAANVMAGLGDLLDGQRDITKGLMKSYRIGGYGGS